MADYIGDFERPKWNIPDIFSGDNIPRTRNFDLNTIHSRWLQEELARLFSQQTFYGSCDLPTSTNLFEAYDVVRRDITPVAASSGRLENGVGGRQHDLLRDVTDATVPVASRDRFLELSPVGRMWTRNLVEPLESGFTVQGMPRRPGVAQALFGAPSDSETSVLVTGLSKSDLGRCLAKKKRAKRSTGGHRVR